MNSYRKFSYYYDEIMEIIDYDTWLEFVKPYLKEHDNILDLACGTGTFAILLGNLGYSVEGLDLSAEVIEIAKEKVAMNHLTIPFQVADMAEFKVEKPYQMITCFFDSVNFLEKEKLQGLFDSVYKALAPGGYFIFDLFTESKMMAFHRVTLKEKLAFGTYRWKMKVKNNTLYHDIKIKDNGTIIHENYIEHYFPYEELLDPRFKTIKVITDFSESLDLENGERILVVLQK